MLNALPRSLAMNHSFYKSLARSRDFTHLPAAGTTTNLGDDIQVECAARLWGTRNYVERDRFSDWKKGMVVPFFGWYGYDLSGAIPEAECILVSFHLCNKMMKHISITSAFKEWLAYCVREQGFPAMARDKATMQFIRDLGIDCEFGGCVTQTLSQYDGQRSGEIAVDAPADVSVKCPARYSQIDRNLVGMPHSRRIELASKRLDVFSKSSHVHTSRIHAYLPAIALGTPATFYHHNIFEPHRLSGLVD